VKKPKAPQFIDGDALRPFDKLRVGRLRVKRRKIKEKDKRKSLTIDLYSVNLSLV
jgi:hypothetical protein